MDNKSNSNNETERFSSFLISKHLKKTPERFEILRCALDYNDHFDVETLLSDLEKSGYHVSRSTIYNTLELLCQCGIIRKLLFDTHQAKYEKSGLPHSHLICISCGKIQEIELPEIDNKLSQTVLEDFKPSYISAYIYGVCKECRDKNINNETYKQQ